MGTDVTYTAEDRAHALAALVANLGNIARTVADTGISDKTLRKWREDYAEQYRDMEDTYARGIEAEIVQRARENARKAGEVVELAVEKAQTELESPRHISAGELAKVARDMSQVHSQNVDKVLTLTGRPSQITESRELVALVQSLENDGVLRIAPSTDSTAEEIPDGGE